MRRCQPGHGVAGSRARSDIAMPGVFCGVSSRRPRQLGCGDHVGDEDVAGIAIEVLAGSVAAQRAARVGVVWGDREIARIESPPPDD